MIRFYINVDYTQSPACILKTREIEGGTKTKFISFCMHATGIWRLFDKDTIKEFLYRLAVIFKTYDIVPKFFTNDTLVVFEHEGKKVELDLKDVVEHFGMEISDSSSDLIDRSTWLENIGDFWRNACIGAVMSGGHVLDKKLINRNKFKIGLNKPRFDEEIGKLAELLATEAIKTIGEEPFTELSSRIGERNKELQKERLALAVKLKHVFNYAVIPVNVKRRFFRLVFGAPASKFKKDFEELANNEDSYLCALIHLAWLWENGYVKIKEVTWGIKISHYAEVDSRMDFDYDRYDGLNKLGIGINIYDTYYDYGLDRLSYMLFEKAKE